MLYLVAFSTAFEMSMFVVVLVNLAVMASTFYQMPDWLDDTSQLINLAIVMVFLLEFVWKVLALRTNYFLSPWNLFEFVILILSFIGSILFT